MRNPDQFQPGQRTGNITITTSSFKDGRYIRYCVKCDCGKEFTPQRVDVERGESRSCGCRRNSSRPKTYAAREGASKTRLYQNWHRMMARCGKRLDYIAKGITVCADWHSFETFRNWALSNGYRDDLTLDRRNNSFGYSPGNCRWAPLTTQAQNRSVSIGSKAAYAIRLIAHFTKLTQEMIGQQFGVGGPMVCRILSGKRYPDTGQLTNQFEGFLRRGGEAA